MNQFNLLRHRRFMPFFCTQALSAFNDNVFRNALVMLVAFQLGLHQHMVALYTNLAPALFILPFFLFSATAGQLAEKYERTHIIRWVQVFEIVLMVIAAVGFIKHQVLLLLVLLFLMGVHSTLFGPIKYAMLPQTLKPGELVGGNGLVEMSTQMAMLIGMIVGNELMQVAEIGTWLSAGATITVAVIGYFSSRHIPLSPAMAPDLQINWNPLSATMRILDIAREDKVVWNTILGISWFWFFGTVMVAQAPIYTMESLGGDSSVYTLILTMFSVGSGVGALCCEKMSGPRTEVGLIPLGALGLTVFGADLYMVRSGLATVHGLGWRDFLHTAGGVHIALDLALIGLFSSFYVVPLFAFMQLRVPRHKLSRIIAGNNIMNSLLIVLAAGFGLGLHAMGMNAARILFCTALLSMLVTCYLLMQVPEFIRRFMIWLTVNISHRVRAWGLHHIPDTGPVFLVCNDGSLMHILLLMLQVQRPLRFLIPECLSHKVWARFIFHSGNVISIPDQHADVTLHERGVYDAVDNALEAGEMVCLFTSGEVGFEQIRHHFGGYFDQMPMRHHDLPLVVLVMRDRVSLAHRIRAQVDVMVDAPIPASQLSVEALDAQISMLHERMVND